MQRSAPVSIARFFPPKKSKMAEQSEVLFMDGFDDILNLLNVCEEENNVNEPFIEAVIYRLEKAVKFMEHILSIVNECKDEF